MEGVSGRTVAPAAPKKHRASTEEAADEAELNKLIVSILEESADTDGMYASELKGILLRLRPGLQREVLWLLVVREAADEIEPAVWRTAREE